MTTPHIVSIVSLEIRNQQCSHFCSGKLSLVGTLTNIAISVYFVVGGHSFKYVKFVHVYDSIGVAHFLSQDNDQFLSCDFESRELSCTGSPDRGNGICDRMRGYAISLVGVEEMLTEIIIFTASLWFIMDLIFL